MAGNAVPLTGVDVPVTGCTGYAPAGGASAMAVDAGVLVYKVAPGDAAAVFALFTASR